MQALPLKLPRITAHESARLQIVSLDFVELAEGQSANTRTGAALLVASPTQEQGLFELRYQFHGRLNAANVSSLLSSLPL
jgi:hypothetical protein